MSVRASAVISSSGICRAISRNDFRNVTNAGGARTMRGYCSSKNKNSEVDYSEECMCQAAAGTALPDESPTSTHDYLPNFKDKSLPLKLWALCFYLWTYAVAMPLFVVMAALQPFVLILDKHRRTAQHFQVILLASQQALNKMKATKCIRKLLKDLQLLADVEEEEVNQEPFAPTEDATAYYDLRSELGASRRSPLESSAYFGTDTTTTLSESYASTLKADHLSSLQEALHDEVERHVQELGHNRVLVAALEAEIEVFRHEKEEQHNQDNALIQRLEAELKQLEQQAQIGLATLKSRQRQIELDLPEMEQQLNSLKEVLHDLDVSEPLYAELLAVPKAKRSVKAHIQVLAYEKMKKYREEMETLRKERDTSRESLTRQNDEVERMQREVQRVTAAAVMEKRETEKEMSAIAARNERLEVELKEVLVKVEVLSAKGAIYDEVKDKLDQAEISIVNADNQRAMMTATLQVVTDEKRRLLEVVKDKDHCLDLLSMDKIYLTREVKAHQDQVKKLEQELQQQQEKLRALKNTRQELYNRVLTDNRDSLAAHEQRLQAELARLQEHTNRDIETIRKEASEAAAEKVKTYRELRDAALAEAETLKAIQTENKSNYDELLTKFQELQRVSGAKEIEARSGIKLRDFEIEQLRVAQNEIRCALNQKSIENEALAEKVKVLTEKYYKRELETERSASLLQNELEITRRNLAHYETQALHQHNPRNISSTPKLMFNIQQMNFQWLNNLLRGGFIGGKTTYEIKPECILT
ncbi:hypothetical protein R1flu_024000 [Riccia fluitans]|uniref:Uncharacterized protein n=1 Tax=Riccia fluitans TaxID=41844 RepID=A0ABD1XTM2_9MARC